MRNIRVPRTASLSSDTVRTTGEVLVAVGTAVVTVVKILTSGKA